MTGRRSSEGPVRRGVDLEYLIEVTPDEAATGQERSFSWHDGRSKRTIRIKVPAGVTHGTLLRMAGLGGVASGGAQGDLYIRVNIAEPSRAHTMLFAVGLVVFLFFSEVLGAQAAGLADFVGARHKPLAVLAIVSALGGAAAMSLMCLGGPYRGLPAAVSGPILSLGIFFATYGYMSWRGTASRAEWLLPFGIGAIPGLLLLRLMNPRKRGA